MSDFIRETRNLYIAAGYSGGLKTVCRVLAHDKDEVKSLMEKDGFKRVHGIVRATFYSVVTEGLRVNDPDGRAVTFLYNVYPRA